MKTPTLLSCLLLIAACGDDIAPPNGDVGPRRDTNEPEDVQEDDVTEGDVPTDMVMEDTYDPEVPCEAETFDIGTDPIARARAVSSAATSRGFVFGWGDAATVREQVRTAELAVGAVEPMVRYLTDDDSSARDVRIADGFAIWLDDGGDGANLLVRGSNTTSTSPPLRVISGSTGRHASPQLIKTESGWLAGWLREDGDVYRLETRAFDNEGEESITTYDWEVGSSSMSMAVADGHEYFAWAADGDVYLAVVTGGEITQAPTVISSQSNATGEVSIAFGQGFGVVSFGVLIESVRREIRVRLMNEEGAPVRPEQVVSRAPLRGRMPNAAAYAGGYVIAYRASNVMNEHHVRVAFVHGSDGDVVAEYNLGDGPFDGGAAGISVDSEGGLGVGWANVEGASGTRMRAARMECDGAWLRCGVMP